MFDLRKFFVSKAGALILVALSAGLAFLLSWLDGRFPGVKSTAEWLINASGGSVVVFQAVLLLCLAGIAWVQRHWAHVNVKATGILQDALNEALARLGRPPVKKDGLLGQETGEALNILMPRVDIPVEKLPDLARKSLLSKAVKLLSVCLVAVMLASCVTLDGDEAAVETPRLSVPLGANGRSGSLFFFCTAGYRKPADARWPLALPVSPLRAAEFKRVVQAVRF